MPFFGTAVYTVDTGKKFFAIAQSSGTVDLLTDWGVRLVRGTSASYRG